MKKMVKDSYWFRHDTSAGRGKRMLKMAYLHGHWGKGIYWDVIEVLREQEGYSYPIDDESIRILCSIILCKNVNKFKIWLKTCIRYELLIENGGVFYSEGLNRSEAFLNKQRSNGSRGGRPKKSPNNSDNNSDTFDNQEGTEKNHNPNHNPNGNPNDNHTHNPNDNHTHNPNDNHTHNPNDNQTHKAQTDRQTDRQKKNVKKNNFSDFEIISILRGSEIWRDEVCLALRISPAQFAERLEAWWVEVAAAGKKPETEKAAKSYFFYWAKLNPPKVKKMIR